MRLDLFTHKSFAFVFSHFILFSRLKSSQSVNSTTQSLLMWILIKCVDFRTVWREWKQNPIIRLKMRREITDGAKITNRLSLERCEFHLKHGGNQHTNTQQTNPDNRDQHNSFKQHLSYEEFITHTCHIRMEKIFIFKWTHLKTSRLEQLAESRCYDVLCNNDSVNEDAQHTQRHRQPFRTWRFPPRGLHGDADACCHDTEEAKQVHTERTRRERTHISSMANICDQMKSVEILYIMN